MIESFTPKDEYDLGRTTGCSCCSGTLNKKKDVLKEVRGNIRIAKEVAEFYKIPMEKLMKDVLTEKKCKKHKEYLKYDFKDEKIFYCWKCNKELKRIKKDAKGRKRE